MESQKTGLGFSAWVSGWSLLVGALAIVLPVYVFWGRGPAVIASGCVALLSGILAWLATEVASALRAESKPVELREAAVASRRVSSH